MSQSKAPDIIERFAERAVDPKSNPDTRSLRSGDRRISDKIQPLLDRIVGILSADSPRTAFFNITESIQRLLKCESLRIFGIDRYHRQLFTRNFVSPNQREIRWDESKPNLSTYVAKTCKPLFIPGTQPGPEAAALASQGLDQFLDPVLKQPINSAIILPLIFEEQLIGVLEAINSTDPRGFITQDFELSKEIGKHLALVLDKLEGVDAEESLRALTLLFQGSDPLGTLLDNVKPRMLELFRVEHLHILEFDPKRNDLVVMQWKAQGLPAETRLALEGKHFLDKVVRGKRRHHLPDVPALKHSAPGSQDLVFDPSWDLKLGIETRSVLAAPLLCEDRLVGVVQLTNRIGEEAFTSREMAYLDQISQLLGNALLLRRSPLTDLRPGKFSYLVENGIISSEELAQAITRARTSKADIETLLETDLGLSRPEIGKSLEQYYGMAYYGYHDTIFLDSDMLAGLNRNFLAKNLWVPIETEETRVIILINEPEALEKVQSIKMTFPKKEIQFRVGLKSDILDFLNLSFISPDGDNTKATVDMSQIMQALSSGQETALKDTAEEEEFSAINESDSSIVRFVNKMIIDAYERRTSDIHIEPGRDREDMTVRFRVDGDCLTYQKVPMIYKQAMVSRIKVMARLDISERRLPQDGKIRVKYGQTNIELRVATGPTLGSNEDVVLRLLRSSKPLALEELNLSEPNYNRIKAKLQNPHGLILVVGPTGSGKTTTLHSFLNRLNTPNKKIWTAEDPIEISQPGIRQLQVNPKIGLTFPQAFRFFLRADPDVIMIGEMRDLETMNIALEASLSGHMVLSTLHTNSAPETVNRLLVMGLNPYMFADSLLLIVAQRLVKTLCPDCAEPYAPTREEITTLVDLFGKEAFFRIVGNLPKDLKLKKAVGCKACNQMGYRGRVGVHEFLECTESIRNLIIQKAPMDLLRKQARADGMATLKQDGILKILQGLCDLKQVLTVCAD